MSNTVLSDNGPFLAMTVEQADEMLRKIVSLEVDLTKEAAITQRHIDKIANEHNAKISERIEERNNLAKKLNSYILAHKERFQKPRSRQLANKGSYGLRTAAGKLVIEDEERVIALSDKLKLALYKTVKKIDEKALKNYLEELEDGDPKPEGVTFEKGEKAFYKVEKKLIEEAERINIE